jgi:hypothetical protein
VVCGLDRDFNEQKVPSALKRNAGRAWRSRSKRSRSGGPMAEHLGQATPGKNNGCLIGALALVLMVVVLWAFNTYVATSHRIGDKHKIVDDILRYQQRYGTWPESIEVLKAKLPDYTFTGRYRYFRSDTLFVLRYSGSGLMGDDSGEFYRSDTKAWKDVYTNRKELFDLEERLQKNNPDQ